MISHTPTLAVCLAVALVCPALAGAADRLVVEAPIIAGASAYLMSLRDGETIFSSQTATDEEKKIESSVFESVPLGEYLVIVQSILNPVGFVEVLMVDRVKVAEAGPQPPVVLAAPKEPWKDKLPQDMRAFLDKHSENYLELTAVFDGSKVPFEQARLNARSIHFLRHDCEYRVKVWAHGFDDFPKTSKVIYDRTFRISTTDG